MLFARSIHFQVREENILADHPHGQFAIGGRSKSLSDRHSESLDLEKFVSNHQKITTTAKVSTEWAQKIVEKLYFRRILFELQSLAKQPKPIITVGIFR